MALQETIQKSIPIRILLASLIGFVPPLIFEKYTFYLYAIASPDFFNYSGERLWFDIIWFGIAGAISTLLIGRERKTSIVPALISSALFIIAVNLMPLCEVRECYASSTDGLAPLRDFLLFGSLGIITSAALLKKWPGKTKLDTAFQLVVPMLVGYALTYYPILHIFAGVTVPFPANYLQWFLSGAPAGLAGSMMLLDRGTLKGPFTKLVAGVSGVVLGLALSVEVPCEACSSYAVPVISIVGLTALFTLPAIYIENTRSRKFHLIPKITTSATIVVAIILLWGFFLSSNYEASVVNGFVGVNGVSFSPLEVGHSFVYSAGYLAIPRVVSNAVGVNVSFGNTTIDEASFPNDFLAAGVGDQSPNCCKDGLDLAYRADAIEFSNGSEAVIARAWWACDLNMACGGYSWQQLLHFGSTNIPRGSLSNWVELEMNWTSPTLIQWFYRIHFTSNSSETPWSAYSSFTPPKIQNHYWDAGLYYVGEGNQPTLYAYFYQFGVSSAYPITSGTWHVFEECPKIVLNNAWTCIPKAGCINGAHSFWKVLYTFGQNYNGVTFSYLGNHEVEFYYSGRSPTDGGVIW
ncbi:MAG: hypothetical protein ACYC7D_14730 [Nitrososphaerales archaeon]